MVNKHYSYEICVGEVCEPQYMELDAAITLAKALFEKYQDEDSVTITIHKSYENAGSNGEDSHGCWSCKYKKAKLTDEPCLNCGPYNSCWVSNDGSETDKNE